ncbi:MAG: hypothetical protein KDC26_12785 [Armatimonadetes bacterium]|nr:hypothetical protein [Armatimonadota bacterium]
MSEDALDWLMEGDPAIRWQTMRDLLDAPESEYQAERAKTATEGWGSKILDYQDPNGRWRKGRWTDSPWIVLQLMDIGIPAETASLKNAFAFHADRLMPPGEVTLDKILKSRMDLCHLGFWLRIGAYFSPEDERLQQIIEVILELTMPDGAWNCQIRNKPHTHHSSFHTTFNVLEGLKQAHIAGLINNEKFFEAEARAMEFMLDHQMYRSDKTGEVIAERFTHLTYPSAWHYRVIRGLDYIRSTPFITDSRLDDPIRMLESQRGKDGKWITEKRIPGDQYFNMEAWGKPSRWVTLKALRILRARTQ